MIPKHLIGKSAASIMSEIGVVCREKGFTEKDYIIFLEGQMLIAITHALCNCDEVRELVDTGEYAAMGRAIAFLNMVLPPKG